MKTDRGRPGGALLLPGAVLALAALQALPAAANLRAPVVVPASPSFALATAGAGLTVERERLRFACGAASCEVTAEYEVTAAAAVTVGLSFVLPVDGPVTARTNARADAVTVAPAAPLSAEERKAAGRAGRNAPPLFRALFESTLEAGRNTLAVAYRQPLGAEETDYGYWKKTGRMVQSFGYEVWPLAEWPRSPAFRLSLAVSLERPAPGLLSRWFGSPRSIACLTSDPSAPVPPFRREQRGGELWYEAELGPSLPDRITCFLADEDLLPRY